VLTIQSALLVVLGFSIAGLIACVLAPAYRRRAARLATAELKRAMPLTAAEIAADKDRIRADYAIRIHKLESNLEDLSLETARQLIEINRRDARISALESDVARLATINEEHENARRVLELTITERLPKVEQRLAEAKKLLFERDREIAALTQTAQRQAMALDEATQINTQQRNDIHRLNATLTTRAARNRDKAEEQKHETEIALRTEIEALRARVRDQGEIIERLQTASAADAGQESTEMMRVRSSLAEAGRALQDAQRQGGPPIEAVAGDAEVAGLKSRIAEQSADLARLTAELAALKAGMPADGAASATGDAEVALKARIAALEAQATEQTSTILGLRAEIAAGNEKLARQATFYMDEMKRLAAGTRPVAPPALAEAQAAQPPRLSLAERMNAPRIATVEISTMASADRALGAAVAGTNDNSAGEGAGSTPAGETAEPAASQPAPARRQSLLQRITGLEKPVA
jgi:uncharacterized coiled-coil protein SlyX